ncbi:hypothetical protein [Halobaculum sp. EA56]
MSEPIEAWRLGSFLTLGVPDYEEITVKTERKSGSNVHHLSWK